MNYLLSAHSFGLQYSKVKMCIGSLSDEGKALLYQYCINGCGERTSGMTYTSCDL